MNKKILTLLTCTALFSMPLQSNAQNLETDLYPVFQIVLENNPDIKMNLASIMSAEGQALQAGLRPNPQAIMELENFGGDDDFSGVDGAELTLGVEQEIEIAGKRTYRKDVANYALAAAKQEAVSQILATLASTHQSYAGYVIAQERLKLAERRLALADKTDEAVKKRVSAAAASDIQHTKVDIEQKAAAIEKAQAIEELASAKAQLERILASGVDQINEGIGFLQTAVDVPEKEQLIKALENLPQAEMMKLKELQAQSNIELAKAYGVPNPTIGLGIRRFNETDSNAFMATLSIPIPISDRNQGNIAQARAERIVAENENRSTLLSLKEASEKVYQQLLAASQEVKSYKNDIIPSAQKAYEQASEGYNSGRFSFLELLDAQRTLYEMQEAQLDSLLKLHQAKAQADFLMNAHAHLIQQTISLKTGDQK
ncbi:MAG: TolC family protein [Alphaproteobacteria bacterium]|nr:TolC family protein [Alphaproteobacteria bacterium]